MCYDAGGRKLINLDFGIQYEVITSKNGICLDTGKCRACQRGYERKQKKVLLKNHKLHFMDYICDNAPDIELYIFFNTNGLIFRIIRIQPILIADYLESFDS